MQGKLKLFILATLLLVLASPQSLWAQADVWQTILSINNTQRVADTPNRIFALAEGVLYSVGKEEPHEVKIYDRLTGLSDMEVVDIAYDDKLQMLLIYFNSGNIDLLTESGVVNLPSIMNNTSIQQKMLNRICISDGKAYLAGTFGLSVVGLSEGKILGTYFQGLNVLDVIVPSSGKIIALHHGQLLQGDEANNLQDPSQWNQIPMSGVVVPNVKQIALDNAGDMYLINLTGVLYKAKAGQAEQIDQFDKEAYLKMSKAGVFVWDKGLAKLYRESGAQILNAPGAQFFSANTDAQKAWVARGNEGIASLDLSNATAELQELKVDYDGPSNNFYWRIRFQHKNLYTARGNWDVVRTFIPGEVKVFDGLKWTIHSQQAVMEALSPKEFFDVIDVIADPKDPNHYFAATWGCSLFEFVDGKPHKQWMPDNSSLTPANPPDEVRVNSLHYDAKGNLWMTVGHTQRNMVMLDTDGKWHSLAFPEIDKFDAFGDLISFSNGTKWVSVLHRGGESTIRGAFVFNDNGTPDNQSDDKWRHFDRFYNRLGVAIEFHTIYCMAIDRNGAVWCGNNNGVFYVPNGANVLQSTNHPVAIRPTGGQEPNLFYMLNNLPVRAIVVDKLNNKWMATEGDGLYLLSEDGGTILKHFRVNNSPMLSNHVMGLALDENTGLLYISTKAGLMTYQTGTAVDESVIFEDLHAYPNPLRPEMPDGVVIAGLSAGANVKILNVAGQIVFEADAVGSSLKWSARGSDGERVASGVYMVMVYDPGSKKSKTIRVAVIR